MADGRRASYQWRSGAAEAFREFSNRVVVPITRDHGPDVGDRHDEVEKLRDAARRLDRTVLSKDLDLQVLRDETGLNLEVAAARPEVSMRNALRTYGFPRATAELSPDEDLVNLLINAAEIEHGLMIQYLFASATAGRTDLAEYLSIMAVEEMGHFLTVQNLLVAFGAEPHLQHGDWIETDIFKPFAFRLEQASKASVAKYTVAEMPDEGSKHIDAAQRAVLPAIFNDAVKSSDAQGVMPHRVGLLYAKIYWLLRVNDAPLSDGQSEPWEDFPIAEAAEEAPNWHITDDLFRPDRLARQGLLENWNAPGRDLKVRKLSCRADALQAIADLSAQGEGFGGSADGHFDKLLRAWELPDTEYPIDASFAQDPWYGDAAIGNSAGRTGDQITNPVAAAFAKMGDKAYEIVVLATAMSLLLPDEAADVARASAAYASMACMKSCLLPCITLLARTPVSADSTAPRKLGGLPYLQTSLLTAGDAATAHARMGVLKDAIVAIAADVQQIPGASIIVKNTAKAISGKLTTEVWPRIEQAALTEQR